MIYKEIDLDIWQPPIGSIRVIQEEADGRELKFNLFSNGAPVDLIGKTVSIYIKKPDNTMIYDAAQISENTAIATLTLQMMAVCGITKMCELQIIDTDNHVLKVSLPPLEIIPSNYDGAIESTDEFTALTEKITEANAAIANANSAAEEARTALDDQKGVANGIATLDANSKLVQMPSASDVGAIASTEKAAANGVATLDENGKLVQLPTPSDIGAATAAQGIKADNAIPTSEKAAASGLATLDASSKLVQMPTASDVGALALDAITSGSNDNGSWVKFPDGTMIVYGTRSVEVAPGTPKNVSFYYPVAFTATPVPTAIGKADTSTGAVTTQIGGINSTNFYAHVFNGTNATRTIEVYCTATGKWK